MIKNIFLLGFVFIGVTQTALAGKLSGSFGAATSYIFRGVSFSENQPAVHGSVNWEHEGVSVGTWISNAQYVSQYSTGNIQTGGTELNTWARYSFNLGKDFKAYIGGFHFGYPRIPREDFGRYELGLVWKYVTFQVESWSHDSFGWRLMVDWDRFKLRTIQEDEWLGMKTSYAYYDAKTSLGLDTGWSLGVKLGYSTYGDEKVSGEKNRYDYMLSIDRKVDGLIASVFLNDTNRKRLSEGKWMEVDDKAIGVAFEKFY